MKQQLVSGSGGSRRGCGRAKARPASGLRRRTLSPFRYRTLLLSWPMCGIVCFAVSELAASAQLPPVQNPLVPGQNPTTAGCSTTEASSCAQVAAKLLPIVMGPSPMEEKLRRLTDGIGGRVSGSPEMAKAVEWAVAAFRTAGIEIHTEKYTLPATWSEGETRLALLGPVTFPLRLKSTGWSPATPPGGIEAGVRSEEHTSELQSRLHLVCRLLLEKTKHTFLTGGPTSSIKYVESPSCPRPLRALTEPCFLMLTTLI